MAETIHPHGIVGHEKSEADVRLVLNTLLVLAISVVLCCAIVYGLFILFKSTLRGPRTNAESAPVMLAPSIRITEHPAEEIKGLRVREDQILNSYGWVDQNAGLVHIPIEKAMEEVAPTLPVKTSQPAGQQAATTQRPAGQPRQQGGVSGNPQ